MKLTVLTLGLSYGWSLQAASSSLDRWTYGLGGEVKQLVLDEGVRRCPYKDSEGYWTIGIGHRVKSNIGCITEARARVLFLEDITKHTTYVTKDYPWATAEVKLVLINMSFQLGRTGLSKFTNTLSSLEAAEYVKASEAMLDSLWYKQTPQRALRLSNRIKALSTALSTT